MECQAGLRLNCEGGTVVRDLRDMRQAKAVNGHNATQGLDGDKLYCDVSIPACTTCTMLLRTA